MQQNEGSARARTRFQPCNLATCKRCTANLN
jgi:hypothetical protein